MMTITLWSMQTRNEEDKRWEALPAGWSAKQFQLALRGRSMKRRCGGRNVNWRGAVDVPSLALSRSQPPRRAAPRCFASRHDACVTSLRPKPCVDSHAFRDEGRFGRNTPPGRHSFLVKPSTGHLNPPRFDLLRLRQSQCQHALFNRRTELRCVDRRIEHEFAPKIPR